YISPLSLHDALPIWMILKSGTKQQSAKGVVFMLHIEPVTLSTDRLTLRPLSLADVPALGVAASDGELWEKKTTTVPRPEGFEARSEEHTSQLQSHEK